MIKPSVFSNHHEVFYRWISKKYLNKTIVHIDSHHDMYKGNNFVWINNYLLFAINFHIAKEIYLVSPSHYFKNPNMLNANITNIKNYISHTQMSNTAYRIYTKDDIPIFYCDINFANETIHKTDIILDIDSDFFVFNGLGSFVDDTCRYLLSSDGAKCLEIIRLLYQKAIDVAISISEFGKYLPLELKLIINYIYTSLTDCSFVSEFDKIIKCFNNLLEYDNSNFQNNISSNDMCLFNAAINYYREDLRSSKSWFARYNQSINNHSINQYINWEYFLYKDNDYLAMKEINKCNIWFNNAYSYNSILLRYYYESKKYSQANDLLSDELDMKKYELYYYSCLINYSMKDYEKSKYFAMLFIKEVSQFPLKNKIINEDDYSLINYKNNVLKVLKMIK